MTLYRGWSRPARRRPWTCYCEATDYGDCWRLLSQIVGVGPDKYVGINDPNQRRRP